MKDIDFLPQWYKDKRRRQSHYRTQFVGLFCLAVVMLAWTAVSMRTISRSRARLAALQNLSAQAQAGGEFAGMKQQLEKLHAHAAILSRIDQHIQLSGAVGELSYLAGEKIKFSRLTFTAEMYPPAGDPADVPANAVRAVRDAMSGKSGPWEGDVRFRVTMTGIAANTTCVAAFVHRLEQSAWFFAVTPGFCRNATVAEHSVSEFEITCYVANYTENGKPVAHSATSETSDAKDRI